MNQGDRAESIFAEALDIPDRELSRFLRRRCQGDAHLLAEVRSLLASRKDAQSFLEKPVAMFVAAGDVQPGVGEAGDDLVGQRIGEYLLTAVLGEGGCGKVYLAEQGHPVRRRVAVKVLRPGLQSREMVARFGVERQVLLELEHPNICKLFEAGTTAGGLPYFVMECIRGLPLTLHCEQRGLPVGDRLALFVSVCRAVQHVHSRGIIHRDLKPSNILVTEEDSQPKVIDFGIAKSDEHRRTNPILATLPGTPMGTLEYMSPEQIRGVAGGVDIRTDVYSLGVILYELLTGSRPFEVSRLSVTDAQAWILKHEPLRASTRVLRLRQHSTPPVTYRELKGDLDWVVLKAMDKEPSRRYTTVSELAADVERFRRSEPVHARPPSAWYRLRKFTERNRAFTVAAAVVLVSLCSATIVSAVSARRAWTARSRATALAEQRTQLAYRNSILAASSNVDRTPDVARKALDDAPEALRDWEWHYLKARVEVAPAFYNENRPMSALAASADGNRIAIGLHDGDVLLWSKGSVRPQTLSGHTRRIQACSFSPDGKQLVSCSSDESVKLWDLENLRSRPVGLHAQGAAAAAFDSRGTRVVSGGADRVVRVWDITGEVRQVREFTCPGKVYSVAFLGAADELVAGATEDGLIRTWEVATGVRRQEWQAAKQGIRALAVIRKDSELISGSLDGSLVRWDADTGQNLHTFVKPGRSAIMSVATSSDGTMVAVGDQEGQTTVWDRFTGIGTAELPGQGCVQGLAFVGSSAELVTATWNGSARFWQVGPGQTLRHIRLPSGGAAAFAFARGSSQLATVSTGGYIGEWDVATGVEITGQEFGTCIAPAIDASGRWVVKADTSGGVQVIDVAGGTTARTLRAGDSVTVSAVSTDGLVVACGCDSGEVKVWLSGELQIQGLTGTVGCTAIAVSPEGRYAAAGFRDGSAALWDLRAPSAAAVVGQWRYPIAAVAFSPGSDRVAFGLQDSSEATVRVVRTADRTQVIAFGDATAGARTMTFSPSGRRIAIGGSNQTVRIWSADDGQELLATRTLDANATALAFSPDGLSLAACTTAGSIYIWGGALSQWRWTAGNPE